MVVKKRRSCNSSGYGVNGNDTSGVTLQVEADSFLLMALACYYSTDKRFYNSPT